MREGTARAWEGGHGAWPASKDADGVKAPGVGTLGCLPGPGKPSQTPISSPVVGRLSKDTASSGGRCMEECSSHLPLGPYGRRFWGPRSHPGCTTSFPHESHFPHLQNEDKKAPSSFGRGEAFVGQALTCSINAGFSHRHLVTKGTLRISLARPNQIKEEEEEEERRSKKGIKARTFNLMFQFKEICRYAAKLYISFPDVLLRLNLFN